MNPKLPVASDALAGTALPRGGRSIRRRALSTKKVVGPCRGRRARGCKASASPRQRETADVPSDGEQEIPSTKGGYYVFNPPSGGSTHSRPRPRFPTPPLVFARTAPRTREANGSGVWNLKARNDFIDGAKELERQKFLEKYSSLCKRQDLDGALELVEIANRANRHDVLCRLLQKDFLRLAGRKRAVAEAMKFVDLIPVRAKSNRTYNMLVSVCVKSNDLQAALGVKEMMENQGMDIDIKLFTNLISACATAGNVEQAFRLYEELKARGLKPDVKVYGALCQTCASALKACSSMERRQQLVLVERAFNVLSDMRQDHVHPDATFWNILITCTARSGQLQRTFEMLHRMQQEGSSPDAYTYSTLIDASTKNGDNNLALKIYKRALLENKPRSVVLYTAAARACISADVADMKQALEIYHHLQASRVEPDDQFFAALMTVAGRSGNVELAFAIHEEMEEQGVSYSRVTCSALISAALWNHDVERACMAYRMMASIGVFPSIEQINSLIMACGSSGRMGEVVTLVEELNERPSISTYTAIISACQRAGEGDLAFAVAREMLQHRLRIDEGICFCLLRVCYNGLVESWYPDESISCQNKNRQKHDSPFGRALLRALHGQHETAALEIMPMGASELTDKAVAIYRSLLDENILPSMKVLDRLFACLRIPQTGEPDHGHLIPITPFSLETHHLNPHAADLRMGDLPESLLADESNIFDRRATQLAKEAIRLEALPPFSMDRDFQVNMLDMPPTVAEVYVLTIAMEMKKQLNRKKPYRHRFCFIVPPFNPKEVMLPSHIPRDSAGDDDAPDQAGNTIDDDLLSGEDEEDMESSGSAKSSTGLGVLAMLRRLKIWCRVDLKKQPCRIWVSPKEINQWVRMQKKQDRTKKQKQITAPNGIEGEKYHTWAAVSSPISNQQRDIRLGLGRRGKF